MARTIEHIAGDDRDYDFAVLDADDVAENVTGWTFVFIVKRDLDDDDEDALFELTSAAGGIVVDVLAEGIGRILVRRAHTIDANLGAYQFGFKVTKVDGKGETLEVGRFLINPARKKSV